MAVYVIYNSLRISLPSSAKRQREITKFCVFWRSQTAAADFSYFNLEFNARIAHLALVKSERDGDFENIYTGCEIRR